MIVFKTGSLCFLFVMIISFVTQAQQTDSLKAFTDTSAGMQLQEVVIKAFEMNGKLKDVPAAVNYVGRQALERFNPASVVMAVNTTPGVHMEERSPGSYRFNIRGSSLRSPFGVRNVKVYFNDLPVTDPGGTTYLNQLGYYNFNSLEIIKGPGSSIYGAGTGGVLLIESLPSFEKPGVNVDYTFGSYNTQNMYASLTTGTDKSLSKIGFQHQQSDGYRVQSALKRDVLNWTGSFQLNENHLLKTTFLYGDLYYQTPGALTLTEYTSNPQMARPAAGGFPSAQTNRASIRQRSFIAGLSYEQIFSPAWSNKTTAYGMFTELRNPTIRNYSKSSEPHAGGRTVFSFHKPWEGGSFKWDLGAEYQQGFNSVSVSRNNTGNADTLQTYDEIYTNQEFAFTQVTLVVTNWIFTAGASGNIRKMDFQRFQPFTIGKQERKFNNEIAPRLAVSKKIADLTIYADVAKGFSPPTSDELSPSGGAFNSLLNPEQGINYELGIKTALPSGLYIDANAFRFSLNNMIVQRRDAGGGDYYINAGNTRQFGIETYISYPFLMQSQAFRRSLFWLSHTWHDFHYNNFKQLSSDFSGNKLPAEPPHTISSGFDIVSEKGIQATVAYYFCDKIPLNDANSAYANAYHLVSLKLGYQFQMRHRLSCRLLAGVENLLDQKYSLGNDINGFGGRYYNAAPRRNYYSSIIIKWNEK